MDAKMTSDINLLFRMALAVPLPILFGKLCTQIMLPRFGFPYSNSISPSEGQSMEVKATAVALFVRDLPVFALWLVLGVVDFRWLIPVAFVLGRGFQAAVLIYTWRKTSRPPNVCCVFLAETLGYLGTCVLLFETAQKVLREYWWN